MIVRYRIPIRPRPKQRPRFGRGHAYTPKDTVVYENAIRTVVKSQGAYIMTGACIVDISCYYKRPKGVSKDQYKTSRADVDNLGKGILDSVNGVCYIDDAQIVELTVSKDYAEKDEVVITIEYL